MLCSIGLLFSSCRKDVENVTPEQHKNTSISVEEAQSWFEESFNNSITSGRKSTTTREPVWELATKLPYQGQEAVAVPLKAKKGPISGNLFKLIIFKDGQGHLQAQTLKIMPSQGYWQEKGGEYGEDFSGSVELEDTKGNLIQGELYNKGEVITSYTSQESHKAGRT